jgi:predicted AAA+ superfamily ATPase
MHQEETVILDEIQLMPNLFPVLRSLIDKKREPGRFVILGSASPDLLQRSSESLAGRITYLEMQPVNFEELPVKDLYRHWLYGGYPDVVTASEDQFRRQWIGSFIKTYIERDLAGLGLNVETLRLQRLLLLLAGINGMPVNKSMLSRSLQVSVPTISRYLEFLEGAFLIRMLSPYATNVRRRVSKSPKLYFTDTGILHGILGIENMDQLFGSQALGHSWEAYVIQQLVPLLMGRKNTYYYQTQSGAEIDLIVTHGTGILSTFEMKYSTAPQLRRGNREAIEALGARYNFVVAPVDEGFPAGENIRVIGLSEAIRIAKEL